MKKTMSLALAAGLACTAGAMAEGPQLSTRPLHQANIAGHVYINAGTGERVITPFKTSNLSAPYFINNDSSGNGNFFTGLTVGTDPNAPNFTSEAVDWGDVDSAADVDCFVYAYATDISPDVFSDTDGDGCPDVNPTRVGFNSGNLFYNGTNGFGAAGGGTIPTASDGLPAAFLIADLPGGGAVGTAQFCGWIITVDLAPVPISFPMGTTDGDGDGTLDIGWGTTFEDPDGAAGGNTTGPFLVLPPGAFSACPNGEPNDLGINDAFDTYNVAGDPNTTGGTWFFGGYLCNTIPDANFPPFSSMYIEMYGEGGVAACPCDRNDDGVCNILDFVAFQGQFFDCAPPADCSSCDINGDGSCNILDFVAYQGVFNQFQNDPACLP